MVEASSCGFSVACLCADWCGTCREYAQVFEALQQALPAHHYRWIDIEDEADALGDIDIETFPTLLVYDERHVLFAGPLTPQPETLRRLLRGLSGSGPARVDAAWEALAARLRVER